MAKEVLEEADEGLSQVLTGTTSLGTFASSLPRKACVASTKDIRRFLSRDASRGKDEFEQGTLLILRRPGLKYTVAAFGRQLVSFMDLYSRFDFSRVGDELLFALLQDKVQKFICFLADYHISLTFNLVLTREEDQECAEKPVIDHMVLSCAYQDDVLLGIDHMLRIAAVFNLIPNEIWLIKRNHTERVVSELRSLYRDSSYAEIWAFLTLNEGVKCVITPPLDHGSLQGQILKGFVIMHVSVDCNFLKDMQEISKIFQSRSLNTNIILCHYLENFVGARFDHNKFVQWDNNITVTQKEQIDEVLQQLHAIESSTAMVGKNKNRYFLFDHIPAADIRLEFHWNRTLAVVAVHLKTEEVFQAYYEAAAQHLDWEITRLNGRHIFLLNDNRAPAKQLPWKNSCIGETETQKWYHTPYLLRVYGNVVPSKKCLADGIAPFLYNVEKFLGEWKQISAKQCIEHREKMKRWAMFASKSPFMIQRIRSGGYLTFFESWEARYLNGKIEEKLKRACCVIVDPEHCVEQWANDDSNVIISTPHIQLESDKYFYFNQGFSLLKYCIDKAMIPVLVALVRNDVKRETAQLFHEISKSLASTENVYVMQDIYYTKFLQGGINMLERHLLELQKTMSYFQTEVLIKTKFWAIDIDPVSSRDFVHTIAHNFGYCDADIIDSPYYIKLANTPTKAVDQYWSLQQNKEIELIVNEVEEVDADELALVVRFDDSKLPGFANCTIENLRVTIACRHTSTRSSQGRDSSRGSHKIHHLERATTLTGYVGRHISSLFEFYLDSHSS